MTVKGIISFLEIIPFTQSVKLGYGCCLPPLWKKEEDSSMKSAAVMMAVELNDSITRCNRIFHVIVQIVLICSFTRQVGQKCVH